MNVLDIILILIFIGCTLVGSLQQPIRQVSASFGAFFGLLIGSLIYTKLAFLASGSTHRTIILGLLIIALGLLAYDLFLNFCLAIGRRFGFKLSHAAISVRDRIISGSIACVTGFAVIWLTISAFSTFPLALIQEQLNSSRIVATVERTGFTPSLFERAAKLLNPFSQPKAFVGVEPTFSSSSTSIDVTQAFTNLDAAVAKNSISVPKVTAWGCGSNSVGSSFMISKQAVVTNAHVIAGASRISIQDANGTYAAQVILFDPAIDVAILTTSNDLAGNPLKLNQTVVPNGTIGSVLGYPAGASFMASDAIVLQSLKASGYDIYGQSKVTRSIYALRANIVPGDSGGPLLDDDGNVLGLVFGNSTTQNRTGYAVAAGQIAPEVTKALRANTIVSNGACAS